MAEKEPNLTDKQKAFCREYVIDWNGSQAAIRAGYAEASARSQASDLLTNPNIRAEIDRIISDSLDSRKAEIKKRVIDNLEQIAWNDLERDEHYNRDGELVSVSRRDRIKSLELLGKYTNVLSDKVELTGKGGQPPVFQFTFVEPEKKE